MARRHDVLCSRRAPALACLLLAPGGAAALVALVCLLLAPGGAAAHPLAPSLLSLESRGEGVFAVTWKTPAGVPVASHPEPDLPGHCRSRSTPRTGWRGAARTVRFEVACGVAGLAGARVGVRGLEPRGAGAVVRVATEDGTSFQAVVDAAEPFVEIPRAPSRPGVIADYLALGARHLVFGLDHVLFVSGLLLLVRGRRTLLLTVSGFTLGHSITLGLVALGLVRVPAAWVEVGIAITLIVLAAEIVPARDGARPGRLGAHPVGTASAFGLVHGLGFAGALSAVGLPRTELPLALLSFNLGIELGQLVWVAAALALQRLARPGLAGRQRLLRLATAYGIGCLAAYWAFERTAAALSVG